MITPDWTLVALSAIALALQYLPRVRCALSPDGHPSALQPARGLAWRCSRCAAWVDPEGLA